MARPRIIWLPLLTLAVILGPVIAGLAGTVMPAFGWFPAAGQTDFGIAPFRALFAWNGFAKAVGLSLSTGVLATALSLGCVALVCAGWQGTRAFGALQKLLSPLLAVPHAAAAFGLAFLVAPSGWIFRGLAPLVGFDHPPDLLIVQDVHGLTMVAGLVAKEVPFLLLMCLAALAQTDATRSMVVAQSLGYGRVAGWIRTVFPRVYQQIRLPVYVVLAYSMSVVDVAIILGPNTPPTLSVQIVRWMSDPDIAFRLQAAAAALVQFALVAVALVAWRIAEGVVARIGCAIIKTGARGRAQTLQRALGLIVGFVTVAAVLAGLGGLAVWSVAGFWAFPDLLPSSVSWRSWMRHGPEIWHTFMATAWIALAATGLALVLTLGCLEAEHRYGLRMGARGLVLLYLPLLIPQTAFLPGLQALLISAGAPVGVFPVILVHLVYVLPYVFLSLGDPFRAWDTRYATIGAALGASADRVLWRVRLPMMVAPVLTAFAVGIAVSVGQYLPTLLVGGGRLQTLTTEAVALSAGGDRRAIGVYGLAQTGAALLPFALAVLVPPLVWRNRRGMSANG